MSFARRLIPLTGAMLMACQGAAVADLAQTLKQVKPSIVAVGLFKATDNPAFTFRGTGFVVGDGSTIATNAHVVDKPVGGAGNDQHALAIQSNVDGKLVVRPVSLLAAAPEFDLAVLRLSDAKLPPLRIRDSDTVLEGQNVAFTGFPIGSVLGYTPVTHRGIISAITPVAIPGTAARQLSARLIRRLRSGSFNIFQLDATAYPGNSGSPVFDPETGDVIGIINMVFVKGTKESALTSPSGITYAIPANFLDEMLRSSR